MLGLRVTGAVVAAVMRPMPAPAVLVARAVVGTRHVRDGVISTGHVRARSSVPGEALAEDCTIRETLTPYQRRITVALLLDDVPIDVLAERLGTTRGALYKTLHMARRRLRTELIRSGHIAPRTVHPATDDGDTP